MTRRRLFFDNNKIVPPVGCFCLGHCVIHVPNKDHLGVETCTHYGTWVLHQQKCTPTPCHHAPLHHHRRAPPLERRPFMRSRFLCLTRTYPAATTWKHPFHQRDPRRSPQPAPFQPTTCRHLPCTSGGQRCLNGQQGAEWLETHQHGSPC